MNEDEDELKRSIDEIRELGKRLIDPGLALRIFETSWDAQIVVNEVGHIKFMNASAELMFGYTRGELYDKHIHVLVPENRRVAHLKGFKAYFEDPRIRSFTEKDNLTARYRDGREFGVMIYIVPIVWQDGTYVVATIRRKL